MKNVAIAPDGSLVGIRLTDDSAAIVATAAEIALFVDDKYLAAGETPPHVSKVCMAMLFINEIERHPNWHARGIRLINDLKAEREFTK